MRFITLSVVLALSATFSATTTTIAASAIATATYNDHLSALPRRHLYPYRRHVADTPLTDAALTTPSQTLHSTTSPSSSSSSSGSRMILKRQRPRRLAGDKRGESGLLDNIVDNIVTPKPATDGSSPGNDVMNIKERGDSESEEEEEEEEDNSIPEQEADEPEQEHEVIAKGDDKNSEGEGQEHTLGDQDPTEPSPEDNTNPSPSDIIEPTDSESSPEPSPTTSAEQPELTPDPEEDHDAEEEGKDEEGHGQDPEATTTTEEQPEPSATTDASTTATDAAPEPTDPAVGIASTTTITTTQSLSSSQMDPTATKASKGEDVGPTTLPKHKEETNGNQMALTIGVIVAAIVIASAVGIWIFRKWKLTPSRQFKSKITGSKGAGMVYGAGSSGHEDRSEYNSYDEIIRPEAYENGLSPMTSVMTSSAMSTPTYPPATAAIAGHHEATEYDFGYASYLQHQQQQQQPMSNGNFRQDHNDYNHYGYDSGVPTPMPMSEASAMRTSVVSNPVPDVIGGVQAVGHNIHGYGSEDYTQNDHFLRELRE